MSKKRGPKIFGIGLGRTGTASLTRAMKILGYTVKHGTKTLWELKKYEFLSDISVSWMYEFLDKAFWMHEPKFILTVRDLNSWLKSNEVWDKRRGDGAIGAKFNRFQNYGVMRYEEKAFRATYQRHNNNVVAYFQNRPDDLLILDICGGEGWEKLCPFLEKPIPDVLFPHTHKNKY